MSHTITQFVTRAKSWKTTASAVAAAVGYTLSNFPGNVGIFGKILTDVGLLLTGICARDNDKSSRQVGVE